MRQLFYFTVLLIITACSGQSSQKEKSTGGEQQNATRVQTETAPKKNKEIVTGEKKVSESEMIFLEGGTFMMGSEDGLPNERPVHEKKVDPFYMDKSPVTAAQFREFIEATGHKTEAEKFGDSGVFNLDKQAWELLPGATWQKPFGPAGPMAEDSHPVTHVSWNDAMAYASWAGKRLPTEAEWEFAARSGKNSGQKFSWGNEISVNGQYFANTWQGPINAPETKDGYLFTSPVGAFGENEAGLTDMGGNVWQWCADIYKPYPGSSESYPVQSNVKVIRGGSFFFDQNGEDSFSVSGRSMNSHETSLFNTGFRCTKDVK
ncbi:formylglycine-generating enzyme family protein [Mariniphaga sediminis]|uniref:Formylglycine-generating enzyme family protein n=1 Tax=Mariniphaga sediminis TaxID=1628158 RepID=A0A399CXJ7_9BACT|nr:formylglycine-generating enzyme family protein [Mariniphaga sediminis]RIH64077.1 formylglycine-generating enzyme family protein [Mariniphaga sediminis]